MNKQFLAYVAASYPILWIDTIEYQRSIKSLSKTVKKIDHKAFSWDSQTGVKNTSNNKIEVKGDGDPLQPLDFLKDKEKSIIFVQDFHLYLKSPEVWRRILNEIDTYKEHANVLVIVSPVVEIPNEINRYVTIVDFNLPERAELEEILNSVCHDMDIDVPTGNEKEEIINCGLGLTSFEFENSLCLAISTRKTMTETVHNQKEQLIRKNATLSITKSNGGFEGIAGLDNLKAFTKKMATARGKKKGRGVLLLGVPGGGKSEFAKRLGKETGRITIGLDFGNLMGGIVGETEQKTRDALKIIDAMEPCILFIDEIEKGLAGTSGYNGDSGTSKRQGGMFLKWLNDHESDVYVVATSNSIKDLLPEFLRAERWDGIFFVDLPTEEERNTILDLYKTAYEIEDTDSPNIENWTGAEIKSLCRLASSMEISLAEAAKYVCPIYKTMEEKIDALRQFAKDRAIPASLSNTTPILKATPNVMKKRTITNID